MSKIKPRCNAGLRVAGVPSGKSSNIDDLFYIASCERPVNHRGLHKAMCAYMLHGGKVRSEKWRWVTIQWDCNTVE